MFPVTGKQQHESETESDGNKRQRWLLGIAGVLFAAVVVVWWPGCRQYPEVTSRDSLRMMKLLYTACNTRDTGRLGQVERQLDKATREGKVSPQEREAFDKIIAQARRGEWEQAQKASLRFAQDQVR